MGIITMPLMLVGLLLKSSGPVGAFRRQGAFSPSTAIRSSKVGIERRFLLERDLKRGVLIESNGRYYVDDARFRQLRRRKIMVVTVLGAIATPFVIALISAFS